LVADRIARAMVGVRFKFLIQEASNSQYGSHSIWRR
jgi:hypothetical protein